ncbi:MAG: SDR family NAD(P)-dependent oxidoreductase [Alteripontixanthobacter sp.]
MNYQGKTVWITGASSGIGEALAKEWAARGANIILSGRNENRLASIASQLDTQVMVEPFDVRDYAALGAATRRAASWQSGGVDIAIANAGISQRSRALNTDMRVYQDIIDIDLTAQIAFSQGLIGHMADRGSGSLLFVSSIAGKVGVPMRTAYCAAKHGLLGYADALRAELSQSGVSVHNIVPGSIATNVSRNALGADGSERGRSDKHIDEGIPPGEAATTIIDAFEAGEREIIVARGAESALGEARRTPDAMFDQVAGMVAAGYMEMLEAED